MNRKTGAIKAANALMEINAASMKRKDRDYVEKQDTQYKKSRADILATANTAITPTTSDDANKTTAGSSFSSSPRSVTTNKTVTASSASPMITRALAREHDTALSHPASPSNKLKHRLEEDHQEEESQDHDHEPRKRYKARSKDRAPSTLSPSLSLSLTSSSSIALSQTSSRRPSPRHRSSSSSAWSNSQLPKSPSPTPCAYPPPRPVDTKQASLMQTLMTLQSATRSPQSSTPWSYSSTPSTVAASETVDTSSYGGDGSRVKVRETAETMIVTIQTCAKKVITKTRQEHNESAQNREVEQCIRVTTLIVDPPEEHRSDTNGGPLASTTTNQSQNVKLTNNSKSCYLGDDGEVKEVDEDKFDFELDIRGTQKRNNFPRMRPTYSLQFYAYYSPNGSFVTRSSSRRSRRSHPSTTAHVGEVNSAPSFVRQTTRGRQSHHHSSNSNTTDGCDHNNNNNSANPTHLHHFLNSTTMHYGTNENIPPPSYKAPIFNFPCKTRAEPVPLILSKNDRAPRALRSSNISDSGTNTNTRNHHPFRPM
ncbi:hypothetical protein EC957_005640 [Mortierella hygrophila]|uniref:Uncharacterized protein n=1 Tax=Mortierella hygrophila TaxID=979708 RepID=A0A9P6F0I1_9FUNG|nr:hypothetical protein EC957_005640 [Mortierella hygrophila]